MLSETSKYRVNIAHLFQHSIMNVALRDMAASIMHYVLLLVHYKLICEQHVSKILLFC